MNTASDSRRRWSWLVLGGLTVFSLFLVFLVTRAGPPRRTIAGARITDDLCGVSGSDQLRNDRETIEQHVARVTAKTVGRAGFRCEKVLRYDYFTDQLAAHGGSERAAMKATIEAPRTPF